MVICKYYQHPTFILKRNENNSLEISKVPTKKKIVLLTSIAQEPPHFLFVHLNLSLYLEHSEKHQKFQTFYYNGKLTLCRKEYKLRFF